MKLAQYQNSPIYDVKVQYAIDVMPNPQAYDLQDTDKLYCVSDTRSSSFYYEAMFTLEGERFEA